MFRLFPIPRPRYGTKVFISIGTFHVFKEESFREIVFSDPLRLFILRAILRVIFEYLHTRSTVGIEDLTCFGLASIHQRRVGYIYLEVDSPQIYDAGGVPR